MSKSQWFDCEKIHKKGYYLTGLKKLEDYANYDVMIKKGIDLDDYIKAVYLESSVRAYLNDDGRVLFRDNYNTLQRIPRNQNLRMDGYFSGGDYHNMSVVGITEILEDYKKCAPHPPPQYYFY